MTQQPLDYTPPTAAVMKTRQEDPDALRYLIAQRRIHAKAKVWQSMSWLGLLVIGLAAPVISVIWPDLALWMGATAGLWIFLGRTLLRWRVSELTTRGAATQEVFDHHVFGMPTTVLRSTLPSVEDVSELAGDQSGFRSVARTEALLGWYPIDQANAGQVAVAIAQRANASYSDRLLRTTIKLYVTAGVLWIVLLLIMSAVAEVSLVTFLAGVLLPVLPAALDVIEDILSIKRAARDRGDLARSIEERLRVATTIPIEGQELLVWQERLYELRTSTPQVPNWLYRRARDKNEAAMQSGADLLGRQARDGGP